MLKIGIIGGSGIYNIQGIVIKDRKKIITPFGDPSDYYVIGEHFDKEIIFLPRHGLRHHFPPHKINYRANIWGFKELGVERILSISAVGGINPVLRPGMFVVPDQIIDMTKRRESTFYEGEEVVHIDFTEPFCTELRSAILKAGEESGIELQKLSTYVCVDGPRLETKAEIRIFMNMGIDIVGMTAIPEANLAREAEICFAIISVVTNYAAGITGEKLTTTEVMKVMNGSTKKLESIIKQVLLFIPDSRGCACKYALKDARM
ncbi:MAG: S-methyl-5'-thioadenosine phosphorylase [Nitrospirae bacterium]|nr:S-methyl-5'-thioadenosine phosphorylase [Nitrospirota bacterium]